MNKYELFSKRLKELRNDMKLTQKQFAEKIGFTQATLSAYENNPKSPSLDIIIDIANKCNVSLDWLCGLSDRKSSNNEIETYSEIIDFFLKIKERKDCFNVELFKETIREYGYSKEIQGISFGNKKINEFFDDWIKMLNADSLFDDDELYALWKEKTLKKYDIDIQETDRDEKETDKDDNLPFY